MPQLESHHGYYLWHYVPSLPAAVIFLLLFLTATAAHSHRIYTTRARFCIPFVIGGLFEFVGYAARASAYSKTGKLMPFIIQSTYILLAPALFAATIYMTLSRLIRSLNAEHLSLVPTRWLTTLFVGGDILSFVVQGSSAGLLVTSTTNPSHAKIGQALVVTGLFLQIATFALFVATIVTFQVRLHRFHNDFDIPWQQGFRVLYAMSAFIVVRSIFRVVEYIAGVNGYLLTHEWTLYVFDSALMILVMGIFYVWHPGRLHRQTDSEGVKM